MTFLNPALFLFSLAALPITVFYLLKVRQRRIPVSTILFWDQVFADKRPRAIWRRLRHWLSWFVQIVIALLIAMLLAGPRFAWEEREARALVVVLDDGASMLAEDTGTTRFERAKGHVRDLIDGMQAGDELAILTASNGPRAAVRFTDHRASLLEGLEALHATHAPSRIAQTVAFAQRMTSGHPRSVIVVVSDGCSERLDPLEFAGVTCVNVGSPLDNVGITAFQARRSASDALGFELLIEVTNFGAQAVTRELTLELEGRIVDAVRLELEPGVPWRRVSTQSGAQGGRLVARLEGRDALDLDDVGSARLPARQRMVVRVVSPDVLFMPSALSAHPLVDWSPRAFPYVPTDPHEIVIYHRDVPEIVPPGRILIVDPRRGTDLFRVAEALPDVLVGEDDGRSPLMQHVHLQNVLLSSCRRLETIAKAQVHAQDLERHPLVLTFDREEGPVCVIGLNTEEGDLPLRTSFPLLLANALLFLSETEATLRPSLATGDTHALPWSTSRSVSVRIPDGGDATWFVRSGELRIGPLDRIGFWSARPTNGEAFEVACQLTRPRESDLRPDPTWLGHSSDSASTTRLAGFTANRLFLWILFALLACEWFLHQRRHIA